MSSILVRAARKLNMYRGPPHLDRLGLADAVTPVLRLEVRLRRHKSERVSKQTRKSETVSKKERHGSVIRARGCQNKC